MTRFFKGEVSGGRIRQGQLPTGNAAELIGTLEFGSKNLGEPGAAKGTVLELLLPTGITLEADISKDKPGHFRATGKDVRDFYDKAGLDEHAAATSGYWLVFREMAPLKFKVELASGAAGVAGSAMKPGGLSDEDRRKRLVAVLARPQQAKFRQSIAERDGWVCAISGCTEASALEAAHLHPVAPKGADASGGSDDPGNGMLLRADIHRLFDTDRLTVDPATGTLSISADVSDGEYRALDGNTVCTGADLKNLEARYA